ncbi:MAG TPA: hypothetical protein VII34_07510, partial [Pyrinomonadaceae bacterium]
MMMLKIGRGGIYLKPTATFLLIVSCLGAGCITGCSLSGLKRGGESTPTPSAQHNSNQDAERSETPAASTSSEPQTGTANLNNEVADQLHTPEKGSDERQAIMDALRAEFANRQSPYYSSHR